MVTILGEEADLPKVVERHRGFDVWFDPLRGIY